MNEPWQQKIVQSISQMWHEDYATSFALQERFTRSVYNGQHELFLHHNTKRAIYYDTLKSAISYDPPYNLSFRCPFDGLTTTIKNHIISNDAGVKHAVGKNLIYKINISPYFDMHFLAISQDHRADMNNNELEEMIDLLAYTKHVGFFNGKDAGAGIPGHMHYQGIIADFPLVQSHGKTIEETADVIVDVMDFPSFALRLGWKNDVGKSSAIRTITSYTDKPYNLVILPNQLFVIPRSNIYSSVIPGWKIASAELAGMFVCRTKEVYETLEYDTMVRIMEETTLHKKEEQLVCQNSILNLLEKKQ